MSLAALYETAALAMTPEPVMDVAEWAEAYRFLGATSPEPGKWHNARAPWLVEPMQAMSPSDPCEIVVLEFASQMAKTEVILNCLGHDIHISPSPTMVVQPSEDDARDFSRERIGDLILSCPELRPRVERKRSEGGVNTATEKTFKGGFLTVVSARSESGLSSKPIRRVCLDEVDRYVSDVSEHGDPTDLAIQRTANWTRGRKILMTSTPTIEGFSRIEKAYLESDRRHWFVPCPHCGIYQELVWSDETGYRLVWEKGKPDEAYYICKAGCVIEEKHKPEMNARGEWRAERPEVSRRRRGYHINALASSWQSWASLARLWDDCHHDPVRLKAYLNLKLAQCWKDHLGTALKASALSSRLEPYTVAPPGVILVTAGVDTQDDRLEISIWGWGAGEESWLLDHIVLMGNTQEPRIWASVDAYVLRPIIGYDGRQIPLSAVAVDTGGHATQQAYQYCKDREKRSNPRVWAVKGSQSPVSIIWPVKPSRKNRKQVQLFTIGVGQCKENIYYRLRMADPGPGYVHLPIAMPTYGAMTDAWIEQLLSEVRRLKKVVGQNVIEWSKVKDDARNEALDCAVYAYAALHGLMRLGLRLPKASDRPPPPTPQPAITPTPSVKHLDTSPPAAQAPKQPPSPAPAQPPRRPGGGWLQGGKLKGWLGGGGRR